MHLNYAVTVVNESVKLSIRELLSLFYASSQSCLIAVVFIARIQGNFIMITGMQVAVWLSGSVVGHINEVTLRRAGLMLRWVTVRGYTVLVFNQATQANSAWSSLRG